MSAWLSLILASMARFGPPLTLMVVVGTTVVAVFNFFHDVWAELIAQIATIVVPTPLAASVVGYFETANYLFPVSELFSFFAGFVVLYSACAAVRIVKSFVPSMA